MAPTIGGVRTEQQLKYRIGRWGRHRKAQRFGATLFQERTTGQPIGWGGLQHSTIGIGYRLTVGYVIAPEAWGRRHATEIAIASVAHASWHPRRPPPVRVRPVDQCGVSPRAGERWAISAL